MSRVAHLLCSAALALAATSAPAQAPDPLATLSTEQRAFLSDPATLAKFGMTPEKLRQTLAGRTPAQVTAYANAIAAAVADARFKPGRDPGEFALNPRANGYNAGTTLRPVILDTRKRDPGPFSLDRYVKQVGGIPTFAHAPVAVRVEDLVAGKVDVAFVGIPLDLSSGQRDAKHAPQTLRGMDGLTGADSDAGVDPGLVLNLADFGDIAVDNMAAERSVDHVRQMIASVAKAGTVPFIVGGDHALMFPDVAAMADVYGAGNVALFQFDAHPELDADGDHFISDRQTLTRLLQQKLVSGGNVTLIGARGADMDAATVSRLAAQGVTVKTMSAVVARGSDRLADDLIAAAKRGPANVFVSFDMSVLDPAEGTAAGRPVPGGLTMRETLPLVRRLCAETKVVGFELLDTAPILDPTYVSALNANYVLHACLAGVALRKQGTRTAAR